MGKSLLFHLQQKQNVMLSPFFEKCNKIYPLSNELKQVLQQELKIIELPKKQHFLRDGERCDYIFVVVEGLLRTYYIKDEEEICSRFMHEGTIGVSVRSFFTRQPGYEFIEAIEPTKIAIIHYDQLQKIYKEHIDFNYTTRVLTESYFVKSEERAFMLRKQTAEERYMLFMENYSNLLMRLPLKYLATYLGMNLETLSRIRNKISR
jgi:CRP/FNR family transcriptional regulator, anaerobic regulatory protein